LRCTLSSIAATTSDLSLRKRAAGTGTALAFARTDTICTG
jgi:hypothetical protein